MVKRRKGGRTRSHPPLPYLLSKGGDATRGEGNKKKKKKKELLALTAALVDIEKKKKRGRRGGETDGPHSKESPAFDRPSLFFGEKIWGAGGCARVLTEKGEKGGGKKSGGMFKCAPFPPIAFRPKDYKKERKKKRGKKRQLQVPRPARMPLRAPVLFRAQEEGKKGNRTSWSAAMAS